MKKLIVLILVLITSQSIFAKSGWQKINFDSRYKLTKVLFLNETTGMVAGYCDEVIFPYSVNSALFRTTNGGLNWSKVGGSDFGIISDLNFFNSSSGYYSTAGPWLNIIMTTSNGGANWYGSVRTNTEDSYQTLFCSSIINSTTSLGGSEQGRIYKTTNSGINWNLYSTIPENSNLGNISFLNILTGYVFNEFLFSGYKTTDGGQSWNGYFSIYDVKKLSFLSQDTMVALTSGTYARSSNSGASWIHYSIGTSDFSASDMYYFNKMKIIAVGGSNQKGIINVTTNGGLNWQETEIQNSKSLNAVSFGSTNVGYAVGDSGSIYKTITGGLASVTNNITVPLKYSLSQNYPNPFNPSTKINYVIKQSGFVSLKIFDLLGKEVASLVNEKQNAGSYAVDFNSAEFNLPSGIYFYTLSAGEFKETKKMVLVK